MTKTLSEAQQSIVRSREVYQRLHNALEESNDLVCKLIYMRRFTLKELHQKVQDSRAQLEHFGYPFTLAQTRQNNEEVIKKIGETVTNIRQSTRKIVKDTKRMAVGKKKTLFIF